MVTLQPAPDPVASIIIPVSAGIDLLMDCLRSLADLGSGEGVPFEVIVVLNEVSAGDEDSLRASVSGVRIISSPVNLGVAGSANRARADARAPFIVLLHDDACVRSGWLSHLVRAAESRPEAAVVGSRVLSMDLTLQNAGCILWRDGSTSSAWLGPAPAPEAFDERRPVDYSGTASMLVRAGFWDGIGGFDEDLYPAYYVDVDLCMTARQRGWLVLYEPGSEILHHRAASTDTDIRTFMAGRNGAVFKRKWLSELQEQEAFDPRDPSGSHRRALARPIERARGMEKPDAAGGAAPVRAFDAEAQQRRHVDLARNLREAFQAHQRARIAALEEAARPVPPYGPGTLLSFAEGGNGHAYLVAGHTHAPEPWGIWGSGGRIRLVLPFERGAVPHAADVPLRLTLTLAVHHLVGLGRSTSGVSLLVDGRPLLEVDDAAGGDEQHAVGLSLSRRAMDCLLVEIEGPEPTTPHALGINDDTRPISIGILSMRIAIT